MYLNSSANKMEGIVYRLYFKRDLSSLFAALYI